MSDALADQRAVFRIGPCIVRHNSGSFLRHLSDDLLNAVVGAAAAKISAKAAPNVFGRGLRVLIEKCFAGDNKPGSAEAALGSIVLDKSLLHRVYLAILHQCLDRGD